MANHNCRVNSPTPECSPTETSSPYVFRREGEFWTIMFNGRAIRLNDRKGFQYMAHLLRDPGREFLVTDLAQAVAQPQTDPTGQIYGQLSAAQLDKEHLRAADLGDAGAMLDAKAKKDYKRRLDDLHEELNEAIQHNDLGRAKRVRVEIEAITDQLAHATGLGGQDRKAASAAERARLSVTKAIKAALRTIHAEHPALGRYLANTIQTGQFCSYRPDPNHLISWTG